MPVVENSDGTLWIDVDDLSEVDEVCAQLTQLGARATALVPDTACEVVVEEVSWSDLYPRIVTRNGPEPGIIVQPGTIPEGHTLLLGVHTSPRVPDRRNVAIVLSLIRGPAPSCYGKIITPPTPTPSDSRLRPARPPGS
jgi:hypothetical protein